MKTVLIYLFIKVIWSCFQREATHAPTSTKTTTSRSTSTNLRKISTHTQILPSQRTRHHLHPSPRAQISAQQSTNWHHRCQTIPSNPPPPDQARPLVLTTTRQPPSPSQGKKAHQSPSPPPPVAAGARRPRPKGRRRTLAPPESVRLLKRRRNPARCRPRPPTCLEVLSRVVQLPAEVATLWSRPTPTWETALSSVMDVPLPFGM